MRRHQAGTWRYLRYLGADAGSAEELAQEALVRALDAGQAELEVTAAAGWWAFRPRRKPTMVAMP